MHRFISSASRRQPSQVASGALARGKSIAAVGGSGEFSTSRGALIPAAVPALGDMPSRPPADWISRARLWDWRSQGVSHSRRGLEECGTRWPSAPARELQGGWRASGLG